MAVYKKRDHGQRYLYFDKDVVEYLAKEMDIDIDHAQMIYDIWKRWVRRAHDDTNAASLKLAGLGFMWSSVPWLKAMEMTLYSWNGIDTQRFIDLTKAKHNLIYKWKRLVASNMKTEAGYRHFEKILPHQRGKIYKDDLDDFYKSYEQRSYELYDKIKKHYEYTS